MSQTQDSFLLLLPEVALENIFSFLSYDEIGKYRIVCRKFNDIGSKLLSRGFIQLDKRHAAIYKRVKSALPRRESERKTHPMARHSDILQAVETRMSMLNMTYMRYIDNKQICFIPGKVLDEIKRVLDIVEDRNKTPPRTHLLLQELRDLSSMAIEHFDEYILPMCREQLEPRSGLMYKNMASSSKPSTRILIHQQFPSIITNELYKVKKIAKSHKHHFSYLTQKLCFKIRKQNNKIRIQGAKLREQDRKLQEQSSKIVEQEAALNDIKKHMDEWDQKYKDLTSELVKARDEILLKASTTGNSIISSSSLFTSPGLSGNSPVQSTSFCPQYKSNIKPRIAHILPKSYIGLDLDRKRKSSMSPEVPLKRNRSPSGPGLSLPQKSSKSIKNITLGMPDLVNFNNKGDSSIKESDSLPSGEQAKEPSTITSFFDNLLSKPLIKSGKARKRKMTEDIDLK